MSAETFKYSKNFILESGKQLHGLQVGYHTFGKLNKHRNNVIWVCHALTANSDVLDWWAGLFGDNNLFNPADHYIVCANVLSSPYGSTHPLDIDETTGQPYYLSFPLITIRDMVKAHQLLADHLGIDQINVLIGGSLGGQQALEWSLIDPAKINNLILIATNALHSPWGIAFNESQRLAITADRTFYSNTPDGGAKGLKAARSIALLSYRGYATYHTTQKHDEHDKLENYKAASYQNYQGEKLVKRFNAYSYWYLSKAMDSHNVGRNRGSVEEALAQVKSKTLVIGIKSDILFPVAEQQYLAAHIPDASYVEFDSIYGHDSFLIETETLTKIIGDFLGSDINGKVIKLQTA
ncbi:homoserine O-acetyltransferase [Mucilaginibacter sp. PPCGB 2223]|uniref:homoserine O-acetyltransferase family protein n=1 Tax=Mucilaginibacter sp. PPCGB 2223 TaxID=1886027 RepID=UPI0008246708|nr:homoserine O-acetyltransferase [Mucilaginibacter sp. PPCGB 2223]OCX53206.1 homoserine O-acetyltransferase [Mucilaginibacter sp. PPCGB 2223]